MFMHLTESGGFFSGVWKEKEIRRDAQAHTWFEGTALQAKVSFETFVHMHNNMPVCHCCVGCAAEHMIIPTIHA
jgi:hypothetical protein